MEEIKRLYEITTILRSENGCPWDRAQTHESITRDLIEESYELIESIEQNDPESMKEELGDVLFQVMFHARLAEEKGTFTLADIARTINEKLVRRHPHVFGDKQKISVSQVVTNWEEIKKGEKNKSGFTSALDGVPTTFPALMKAEKLQAKAAKTGFDWERVEDVETKLEEEIAEFRAEIHNFSELPSKENLDRMEDELGDILFTIVNIARHLKISPELALNRANEKFKKRFLKMEQAAGGSLKGLNLEEMDLLWARAKI